MSYYFKMQRGGVAVITLGLLILYEFLVVISYSLFHLDVQISKALPLAINFSLNLCVYEF